MFKRDTEKLLIYLEQASKYLVAKLLHYYIVQM